MNGTRDVPSALTTTRRLDDTTKFLLLFAFVTVIAPCLSRTGGRE